MRAVLDANVIVSALLSRSSAPARIMRAWERGTFEIVASAALLDELERALAYPKLRARVPEPEARQVVAWLREGADLVDDPDAPPPLRSSDPGDDYLIALAAREGVPLVSGDKHLLDLADRVPVLTPAGFLELVSES